MGVVGKWINVSSKNCGTITSTWYLCQMLRGDVTYGMIEWVRLDINVYILTEYTHNLHVEIMDGLSVRFAACMVCTICCMCGLHVYCMYCLCVQWMHCLYFYSMHCLPVYCPSDAAVHWVPIKPCADDEGRVDLPCDQPCQDTFAPEWRDVGRRLWI